MNRQRGHSSWNVIYWLALGFGGLLAFGGAGLVAWAVFALTR